MSILLSDLTAGAIQLADMLNDTFVSAAQWRLWCGKDAVADLHQVVSTAFVDTFFTTLDFTLASGGYRYTLPTDFMRMRGLDLNPGTPQRTTIHRFNFGERNGRRWGPGGGWTLFNNQYRPLEYRVVSRTTLIVEPEEACAGNYRLYYVARPTLLVNDSDALQDELAPFWEYIQVFAAIKALAKKESNTSELKERLATMKADIMASAQTDENEADKIVDVEDGWIPSGKGTAGVGCSTTFTLVSVGSATPSSLVVTFSGGARVDTAVVTKQSDGTVVPGTWSPTLGTVRDSTWTFTPATPFTSGTDYLVTWTADAAMCSALGAASDFVGPTCATTFALSSITFTESMSTVTEVKMTFSAAARLDTAAVTLVSNGSTIAGTWSPTLASTRNTLWTFTPTSPLLENGSSYHITWTADTALCSALGATTTFQVPIS